MLQIRIAKELIFYKYVIYDYLPCSAYMRTRIYNRMGYMRNIKRDAN